MTAAERVKYARERRGLSCPKLSDAAGLSNAYVTQLERSLTTDKGEPGRIESPGLDALEKLAVVLGVPVEWLAFGVGADPFEGQPDTERAP
jgi:transcriptional regulator with XRE-family HTH domain